MAATEGNGFSVRAQPARVRLAPGEYLRCPNCNSADLKKVSLAYQEGLFCTAAHTRFSAGAAGGHGPGIIIGKATTRGLHQSLLSERLSPPVKWSYRKLIRWWAVLFLSIDWIVFYVNTFVIKNFPHVLSPPVTRFALLSAATFVLLLVLFWRHNRSAYKRQYSKWDRSYLCPRCGTLTEQG